MITLAVLIGGALCVVGLTLALVVREVVQSDALANRVEVVGAVVTTLGLLTWGITGALVTT